jgi:MATE family multidrug resistance protein
LASTALPRPIAGLFLNSGTAAEQEAVLGFAVVFLSYAAVFQIFDAIQVIGLSILRGLKDTRVPMVLTAVSYWGIGLSLSAGLAFGLHWGGRGIWSGYVVALGIAAILMVGRFAWRERFKTLRQAIDRAAQDPSQQARA